MGVLITTVDVGDVVVQGGHGAPSHIATRGTLYVDFDSGTEYINKDGAYTWAAQIDGSFSGLTAITTFDTYVTGGTFNPSTGTATFTNNSGNTFSVTGFSISFTGGTFTGATVFTGGLTANTAFIGGLTANTAFISALTSNTIVTDALTANTAFISALTSTTIVTDSLTANTAFISALTATTGFFESLTANTAFVDAFSATTISATTYLGLPLDIYVTGGTLSSGTTTFTNNTGGTFDVTGLTTDNVVNVSNISATTASDALNETTVWRGNWIQDVYIRNQQVIDGSFLAIANKTTEDRPAPQPIGPPYYVYTGDISTTSVLAKQVLFGNRYEFNSNLFLEGWRVNVVAGNNYIVYLVEDPTGLPILTQIINVTPHTTGWINLNLSKTIVLSGSVFDIVVLVNEPDPTPTTFSGNWAYSKPTNVTPPTSGQITHANKALAELRVHKVDNDAINQESVLSGLSIGDIISADSTRWAIQSSTDNITYFTFGISPATQLVTSGVKEFTFETVTSTPITYPFDSNYWTNFPPENINAQGLLGVDSAYQTIVPDGTAYGVDILVREILPSPDWDIQAFTSVVYGGGGDVFESGVTITINGVEQDLTENREWLTLQGNTGILDFSSGITLNNSTAGTINIAAMYGYIVDNETNPAIPVHTFINYTGSPASGVTVSTRNSGIASYLLLNLSGTPVFQNTFPTSAQRKQNIWLGKIAHPMSAITTVINEPDFLTSPQSQVADLFQAINYINDGVYPYASGANLSFNVTSGNIHGNGINLNNSRLIPNEIQMGPVSTGTSFVYRTQTGGTFTATTSLIPGSYDVGGVVTTVGGGSQTSTIQWIFCVPGAGFVIQFGQTQYTTLAAAIAAIGREQFIVFQNLIENSILIGVVALNKSTTQLNNTTTAQFFRADKFGQIIGAQAGISTTNLQDAYNNSLQPQITTTSGALQLKGSAIGENILQVINSAGTITTFTVNELGNITGNTLNLTNIPAGIIVNNLAYDANGRIIVGSGGAGATFTGGTVTGPTIFLGGLSSTTVSATTYLNLPLDIFVTGGTFSPSSSTIIFTNRTGGTFNVTGISSSATFTGGTVTGATIFTGGLSANTFSATTGRFTSLSATSMTGVTGRFTNLSATTISATTYLGLPLDIRVTGGTFTGISNNIVFTNNSGGTFSVTGVSRFLQYYAEYSGVPTSNPIATGTDSIALGDGARALSNDMFVYGRNAGVNATGATDAILLGHNSGNNAMGVLDSVFIGRSAAFTASGSLSSVFIGPDAGNNAMDTISSVYIGDGAGNNGYSNSSTIFIGTGAGAGFATGLTQATFIGRSAGNGASNVNSSNFIGYQAGINAIGSGNSNFIGRDAGNGTTGVSFSNIIGYKAGMSFLGNYISDHNTIIGTNITLPHATTRGLNIGGVLFGRNLNDTTGGNPETGATPTGRIGINIPIPTQALEVSGNSRIYGSITANTIVKSGGTSVQFLMADGSVSLGVSGGTFSGNSIFTNITANTIFATGITANTVSATTYLGLPLDIRVTGGTLSGSTAVFRNNTGGTFNVTGFASTNEIIIAGESVVYGNLLYLNTDGKYYKASNTTEATSKTELRLALASILTNAAGNALIKGQFITTGLTTGSTYWVGTNGNITFNQPTSNGNIVRYVGTAESDVILEFNPDQTYIEIGDVSNANDFASVRSITTSQTALVSDFTIICLTGLTLTIPTAVGYSGKIYNIKSRTTENVVITGTSGQFFDDDTGITIVDKNTNITIQSDDSNWIII